MPRWQMYLRMTQERSALDFADMIPLTLLLLKQNPQVLKQYRDRYQHVFCDEYQDVSQDQFDLMHLLCIKSRHLTVRIRVVVSLLCLEL